MFCPVTRFFEKMAEEDLKAEKYERLIKTTNSNAYDNMVTYNKYTSKDGIDYIKVTYKNYVFIVANCNQYFVSSPNPFDGGNWNSYCHIYKDNVEILRDPTRKTEFIKGHTLPTELRYKHIDGFENWLDMYKIFERRVK